MEETTAFSTTARSVAIATWILIITSAASFLPANQRAGLTCWMCQVKKKTHYRDGYIYCLWLLFSASFYNPITHTNSEIIFPLLPEALSKLGFSTQSF